MPKNPPYNKNTTNAKDLFDLLEPISKFFGKKIKMYALGGTALTILNIKPSTLDIDINIHSEKDYKYICKIFEQINFKKIGSIRWLTQEGLAFDLFHSSNIMGTQLLDDCLKKSKLIKEFDNIELYSLSLYDIIISKLARGDKRDFDDIKSILESKKIDLSYLIERYHKTMQNSIVANSKQKLLDLLDIKFKDWNYKIDQNHIKEIKKWE